MNKEDGVEELITQLKSLQIKQAELLERLERAREREDKKEVVDEEVKKTHVDELVPTEELAIGDKVRIRNPNPFQASRGTIIKIGASRVTIQTKTGTKILRAQKNVILEHKNE